MTNEEMSIIGNRMKTIVDMYDRHNTIADIAGKAQLPNAQVAKVLSAYGYYHGIKRDEPVEGHSRIPIIFYENYKYLLDYDMIDAFR